MNIDILDSSYIVWECSTTSEILLKRNTITFDPSIYIGSGDSPRATPAVAASGNNVSVVYRGFFSGNQFPEIVHRRSADGGASFGAFGSGNLSGTAGESSAPAVAASGNNVYVVWSDNSPGNFETLYRRSTDGGENFGDNMRLSFTAGESSAPAVAASGNNVYVVWHDSSLGNFETLYSRSTDGGASFDITAKNISNVGSIGEAITPAVAASGNNVYVVWSHKLFASNHFIVYGRSTDGGASFGDFRNLSDTAGGAGEAITPAVAASGNNVYVVWGIFRGVSNGNTPGRFVLYRRSTDGGASFGDIVNINEARGQRDGAPAVAASGDNVYVVWCDSLGIFYRRSTDGGASFGSIVNISNTIFNIQNPVVAASSNLT